MTINFGAMPGAIDRQAWKAIKKLLEGIDDRLEAVESAIPLTVQISDAAAPTATQVVIPIDCTLTEAFLVTNTVTVQSSTVTGRDKGADVDIPNFSLTLAEGAAIGDATSVLLATPWPFTAGDVLELKIDLDSTGSFDGTVTVLLKPA